MAYTSLTMFIPEMKQSDDFEGSLKRQITILGVFFFAMTMFYMPSAIAQSADGLCQFASFLKTIATTAAIIALILFVINSFFIKSSVIGDIIMYVIIGCVLIAAATEVINLTGLNTSCTL